jgi:hypothetical protein
MYKEKGRELLLKRECVCRKLGTEKNGGIVI